MRHLARGVEHALDVRFSGSQHPDVRKHQRTAAFGGADQVRPLIARHAKIRTSDEASNEVAQPPTERS
jgi:hypothetical protein